MIERLYDDESTQRVSGWSLTMAAAAGAMAGATAALLLAPRTGRESREMIADNARLARERARDLVERGRAIAEDKAKKVSTVVDRVSTVVDEGRERFGAAIDQGRQAYSEASQGVKQGAQTLMGAAATAHDGVRRVQDAGRDAL